MSRWILMPVLTLLMTGETCFAQSTLSDLLSGTWKLVERYEQGKRQVSRANDAPQLVFTNGVATFPGGIPQQLTYKLNQSANPASIDFVSEINDNHTYRAKGIFERNDDTLKLVINSWPDGPRPTRFSAIEPQRSGAPTTHRMYAILKRLPDSSIGATSSDQTTQEPANLKVVADNDEQSTSEEAAKGAKNSKRQTQGALTAAYIYADQESMARQYSELMEVRRIDTRLVAAADLSEELLKDVDLIVAGSDTHRVWATKWAVDVIAEAEMPILGMGRGGYELFGQLGLKIGKPHGETVPVAAIRPDPEAIFWDNFHREPTNGVFDAYSGGKQTSIKSDDTQEDIIPVAEEAERKGYVPLVIQKPYYLFWGFQGTPEQVTDTGRFLFPWACYYSAAMKQRPERAFATKSAAERERSNQQSSDSKSSNCDQ